MTEHGSNTPHISLLHFHVCVHCGSAIRREALEGRSLTSGVIMCPKCGVEGPLNVEILESLEPSEGKNVGGSK